MRQNDSGALEPNVILYGLFERVGLTVTDFLNILFTRTKREGQQDSGVAENWSMCYVSAPLMSNALISINLIHFPPKVHI